MKDLVKWFVNTMNRHFVSYPKSGRTWLRYILVQLELDGFIHFHHDCFEFNDGTCPPHNFEIPARLNTYSNVDKLVYLERDPRDVMVSLYFQVMGRFKDFFRYKGSISEFIRHDYFGALNLYRFREMWCEIISQRQFLVVSYEDCHRNMAGVFRKLLDYYELTGDPCRLTEAIENAEFERMKRLEQSGQFPHPWLRPRLGAPKVRNGKVGGFWDMLDPEDVAYLNDVFRTATHPG